LVTKVFSVVESFSLVLVAEVVFDWAQEQLQEQLQDFPPRTEFAFSVLISETRFKFAMIFASFICRPRVQVAKLNCRPIKQPGLNESLLAVHQILFCFSVIRSILGKVLQLRHKIWNYFCA